ncbi:MAG TPA: Gfo/Idh/MocA family oxidoreductase [Pseudolabrys sp.]|nr:Gfo/Idh/MocA family oxidoreductase [Pseudolabrys sp.]
MTLAEAPRLRIGIAGLGRAFSIMLPTLRADPRVTVTAAADPRPEARRRFTQDFGGRACDSVAALCADPQVDIIYVASPHQHHAEHARLAAEHGKHLLVEKPIALTLDEAQAMVAAARKAGIYLIVGHSHSYDAPILHARDLIASGQYGAVRMITALNCTDFLYRPRRPEELDTALGGGAMFNQAPHQVDIVRLLGGGKVTTVRAMTGNWDTTRPTEGAYAALLGFENGAFASLVYNGYGHFDSDEFMGWIGEMGERKQPRTTKIVRRFADPAAEAAAKAARAYGGSGWQPPPPRELLHQHFGMLLVSCDHAELRPLPTGVMIYENGVGRLDPLPAPAVPRVEVIDELYGAVIEGRPPLHDGAWATATMEVCLAMLRSSREGREIPLQHQTSV